MREKAESVPSCPTMGEVNEGRGVGNEVLKVGGACRGIKKVGGGSLGQRWLPVCLWNTFQLALTVNAEKKHVPKAGQWSQGRAEGGRWLWLLRWHACGAGDGGFDDGAWRGSWPFIGPESLGPE